jgi:hypothetical protein
LMPWKRRFCSYCEDFLEQIFSCIGIDRLRAHVQNAFHLGISRLLAPGAGLGIAVRPIGEGTPGKKLFST